MLARTSPTAAAAARLGPGGSPAASLLLAGLVHQAGQGCFLVVRQLGVPLVLAGVQQAEGRPVGALVPTDPKIVCAVRTKLSRKRCSRKVSYGSPGSAVQLWCGWNTP